MISTLSLALVAFAVSSIQLASAEQATVKNAFADFCKDKDYCKDNSLASERAKRFSIFEDNHHYIERRNKQSNVSYSLGITPFADLTHEEYQELILPRIPIPPKDNKKSLRRTRVNGRTVPVDHGLRKLPGSVDWRELGAVTNVKNQARCGSCYSFSALGAIEGAVAIAKKGLVSLSEQEIVDCDRRDHGCNGGLMDFVFEYAIKNHGLCREEDYPYKARHGRCKAKPQLFHPESCDHISPIESYVDVKTLDEEELLRAVAQQPVAVAIAADSRDFQLYSSGVFDAPCNIQLNHGVLAVGYGSTATGQDYWVVKNSWGEAWGDQGYIKMARNIQDVYGQCGIAISPSYPVVASSDE